MGLIISRFRKKETTIEVLEGIDKDISRLQKNRKDNQDRQKRIATSLLIYSFILYVVSAVIFFLLYFPETWMLRFLYSLPLLAFPFLIWGVRKLLHWYFVKRIHGNDLALRDLRERKKQILEDVMETETYKKAKEILEKFDPARFKRLESNEAHASSGGLSPTSSTAPGLHHRKPLSQQATSARMPQPTGRTPNPFQSTPLKAPAPLVKAPPIVPASAPSLQKMPQPMQQPMTGSVANTPAQMQRGPVMGRGYAVPPGPPMPRSVLPRERGTMDRFVDYLVGDGPENRYALICNNCHSHNGMALKEEFEYLSFRCCYCYSYNPARKQRPMAPRLEFFTPGPSGMKPSSGQEESDDDDDEEEDYDDEEEAEGQENGHVKGDVSKEHPDLKPSPHTTHSAPSPPSHNKRSPAKVRDQRDARFQSKSSKDTQPLRGPSMPPGISANPMPTVAKKLKMEDQKGFSTPNLTSSNTDHHPNVSTLNANVSVAVDRSNVESLPSTSMDKTGNQNESSNVKSEQFADDCHPVSDVEILTRNEQTLSEVGENVITDSTAMSSLGEDISKEESLDFPHVTDLIKDEIREDRNKKADILVSED